ncbi:hypothetical protein ACFL0T_08505 [Candidatus Omnitrophota bacterium]
MKKLLLGIKAIAWFLILQAVGAIIIYGIIGKSVGAFFEAGIRLLVGIYLLKGKELARECAIVLGCINIGFFVIAMVVAPIVASHLERKGTLYEEKKIHLLELESEGASKEEINKVSRGLNSLIPFPEHFKPLRKRVDKIVETTELGIQNIAISLLFPLFIVYYLRKPYVKKQFG